ncbi:ion channel [Nocardioides sp. CER19]|uniref:ion channel n=1 Tax=Nocardioides sp. CER19 TaxID=3038538 RepID=UPI00244CB101|nr:ion channel [Nocardioides sp. CER19]MDH2416528.1 ion channel [Nocardioides sp. CER19]
MRAAETGRVLRSHPSGILLAGQLAVILSWPFLDGSTTGRAFLGVIQLIVVLSAVAAVRLTPALTWVALLLGAPAMVFAVGEALSPGTDWVVLTSAVFHVPFYGFVSYALIRYLFNDDRVTSDEIMATGAAFTVVAWGFAYLYSGVQVVWPGSFGTHRDWYELLFLSFSTMSNTGLSDLVPSLGHARSVAMVEMVVGVFYIGLVIARIVGLASRPR